MISYTSENLVGEGKFLSMIKASIRNQSLSERIGVNDIDDITNTIAMRLQIRNEKAIRKAFNSGADWGKMKLYYVCDNYVKQAHTDIYKHNNTQARKSDNFTFSRDFDYEIAGSSYIEIDELKLEKIVEKIGFTDSEYKVISKCLEDKEKKTLRDSIIEKLILCLISDVMEG